MAQIEIAPTLNVGLVLLLLSNVTVLLNAPLSLTLTLHTVLTWVAVVRIALVVSTVCILCISLEVISASIVKIIVGPILVVLVVHVVAVIRPEVGLSAAHLIIATPVIIAPEATIAEIVRIGQWWIGSIERALASGQTLAYVLARHKRKTQQILDRLGIVHIV